MSQWTEGESNPCWQTKAAILTRVEAFNLSERSAHVFKMRVAYSVPLRFGFLSWQALTRQNVREYQGCQFTIS